MISEAQRLNRERQQKSKLFMMPNRPPEQAGVEEEEEGQKTEAA